MSISKIIVLMGLFMISGKDLYSSEIRASQGNQSSTSFENWTGSGSEDLHCGYHSSQAELIIADEGCCLGQWNCYGEQTEEDRLFYADYDFQNLNSGMPLLKQQYKEPCCDPSQCCWDIIKRLDLLLGYICFCHYP